MYCMAINARRYQLVCGCNGGIRVYALDESKLTFAIIRGFQKRLMDSESSYTACLPVFQSHVADGRMIMKNCV